jgi:hypothetical protein
MLASLGHATLRKPRRTRYLNQLVRSGQMYLESMEDKASRAFSYSKDDGCDDVMPAVCSGSDRFSASSAPRLGGGSGRSSGCCEWTKRCADITECQQVTMAMLLVLVIDVAILCLTCPFQVVTLPI